MKTETLSARIGHDTKLASTHLSLKQPNDVTANAILELSQDKGYKTESVASLVSELTASRVENANA